jgi:drug/metabolite transporter (DMT)-like permease
MKLTRHQLGILAIIANAIIWGAASPIFKWSLSDTPTFTLAFFRFTLASLFLLPFVYRKLKVSIDDFYKLLILSFVGIVLHITTYFLGLSLAPSINVPIIATTAPVFLILGAMFFLKEKPQRKVVYGTAVSLIGFLIVVLRPVSAYSFATSLLGNTYLTISTIFIVIYTLLLKKYTLKYDYMTIMFWLFFIGALAFLPMFLLENHGAAVHFTMKAKIGILYGAILSSIAGYFTYNYAVRAISTQEIGIFTYLDPFATAIVAIPLLGEVLTPIYLLGSLFVFLGIYIAERRIPYHPIQHFKKRVDP